jgi:hypothetical protein
MKKFLHSRDGTSKGAALIIVLAFVVLVTVLGVTYFSRATTDRQLAQSSSNDTSANLLARSALDITVSDLKQEILAHPTPTAAPPYYIQPGRYPVGIPDDNPNLIRYSSRNAAASRASTVRSTDASANGRSISLARWNSHYLIPPASATGTDSTPVNSFIPPDWVLVTRNGPVPFSAWQSDLKDPTSTNTNYVVGRYAFAVYDEGGLIDVNVGGFPNYVNLTRPTRPARRLAPKYPVEESEIMLAVFTPNAPCPKFNQSGQLPRSIPTGAPFSWTPSTNHPGTVSANFLPHGLSINPSTGNISGIPTSPGIFNILLSVTAPGCPIETSTWTLTVTGFVTPDSTPWPVNRARKGTLAFADLTALPSTPTAIIPTTPVGNMGNFLTTAPIDQLMGWRNYATTQQTGASFNNPSFPLGNADFYARNFLGAAYPLATSFTTVSTAVQNNRTDQAAMNRQELTKLQRTLNNPPGQFPQSLLQYLGTFSREKNRPAQDWPLKNGRRISDRFDMTNLQIVIPGFRIRPGNNGKGHAWGLQKKLLIGQLFGLEWVDGNFNPVNRFTNPDYYGHWVYPGHTHHDINSLPADPDFFQIINYATNEAVGVNDPNRIQNTFNIGAALIDLYDGDDLNDPDPNNPGDGTTGNTITIIDYGGASYAYGIEAMSYDDPNFNLQRPPLAPNPLSLGVPANYVLLNRRFENVGEFGYAYNPASIVPSKTLDFASSTSKDRALLDFFTYNEASPRAGIVNLNTRNIPVLASLIKGALLNDPGAENTPTALFSQPNPQDALTAAQAIVQETTNISAGHGPALTRADIARLAKVAADSLPTVLGTSDERKQTIARALADTGQARTWNVMIDVIAQTGHYGPNAQDLTAFIPEGEKRYWLHIALDRDDGTVLGTQLEEVIE